MRLSVSYSLLFLVCISFIACDKISQWTTSKPKGKILSKVGTRTLYLSELEGMINAENKADSTIQINGFVNSWLKRNVVLTEAEDKLPSSVNIDKMVDDYRASLLLHNYRQALVAESLDTTVTATQEQEYYEKNKDQYLLSTPICMARVAIISDKAKRLEKFFRNWQKNDSIAIAKYLEQNATDQAEYTNAYISVDELVTYLPEGTFKPSSFDKKGDFQKHFDQSELFIKIVDFKDKNEIAPLSYIRPNIRKVIIHKRKKQLLENIEQNLFNKYSSGKKFKIYEY